MRKGPVERASAKGHNVKSDPPAGMTAARRWTCLDCGFAVIDYCGNIYGSAVERDCPAVFWRVEYYDHSWGGWRDMRAGGNPDAHEYLTEGPAVKTATALAASHHIRTRAQKIRRNG